VNGLASNQRSFADGSSLFLTKKMKAESAIMLRAGADV
jgi:hypothetical protein